MESQLHAVLAANEAYQQGQSSAAARTPEPSRHLVILTCMDARLDLFRSLGLAVGEAHILRNAGGRVSPDVIRSLVVSSHLLGTREVGVIHHTNCGLEGKTNEEIATRTGAADLDFLAFPEVDASVRSDVDQLRASTLLPDGFTVWGAVYDVDTGGLRVVTEPT